MYRAFFRFHEQPFNLTPDPKFLYLNGNYREALAALRYGITERKGFVSLIGEAGTGKTTLLRTLLADLPEGTRSVLVLNPAVGFDELLTFILADLGKAPQPGTPKLALLQALNTELLDTLGRGGNVVVLIDEAQDLAIPVLEELRLLSNLETAKEKILQFVLAGQPELGSMLARPELRQLRQRIAVPVRLRPLRRPEVAAYVAARLRAAGGDPGLFTRLALYRLWRFSRGIPRLLNVACDNALLSAYAAGAERVGWRITGEAVHDLRAAARPEPHAWRWRMRFGTVVAAALVGSITGIVGSRLLGLSLSRPAAPPPRASVPAAPSEAPRDLAGSRALEEPPPVEAKAPLEHARSGTIAPLETKPPPEGEAPVEAKAPPETKPPPEGETPVEPKAPVAAKAPVQAKAPVEPKTPLQAKAPPSAVKAPAAVEPAEVAAARDVMVAPLPVATAGVSVSAPSAEATPAAAALAVVAPPRKQPEAAPEARQQPIVPPEPGDQARLPPEERKAPELALGTVTEPSVEPDAVEEGETASDVRQDPEAAPPAQVGEGRRVRVEAGDTLTEIARRYYGYEGPQVLAGIERANPSLVDVDVIEIGQTIVLPVAPFRVVVSTETPVPPAAPAAE